MEMANMGIISNTPIILTNEQRVEFRHCSIIKTEDGQLSAKISFAVFNENGNFVKIYDVSYEGEEFNTWWTGFTNGKFLYECLNSKLSLVQSVPDDIEQEFTNVVEQQEE